MRWQGAEASPLARISVPSRKLTEQLWVESLCHADCHYVSLALNTSYLKVNKSCHLDYSPGEHSETLSTEPGGQAGSWPELNDSAIRPSGPLQHPGGSPARWNSASQSQYPKVVPRSSRSLCLCWCHLGLIYSTPKRNMWQRSHSSAIFMLNYSNQLKFSALSRLQETTFHS